MADLKIRIDALPAITPGQEDPAHEFPVMKDGIAGKMTMAQASVLAKAAVQTELDAKVPLTGGAITGNLTISGTLHVNDVKMSGIPPGTTFAFSGESVPSGWLLENGASVSRAAYPDLFAEIGTMYGNVDEFTFNLPNSLGKFLRGWNNGSGNDPDAASRTNRGDGTSGDAVGTLQGSELESHNHAASSSNDGAHTHTYSKGNIAPARDGGIANAVTSQANNTTSSNGNHNHTITVNSEGGSETRPANIAKMWIIKT